MENKEIHPRGNGDTFDYMFLGRLQLDCKYFIGCGGANPKCLWAQDVELHISKMKEFFNSFKGKQVPDWISMKDIEDFEFKMKYAKERAQIVLI